MNPYGIILANIDNKYSITLLLSLQTVGTKEFK